MTKIDGFCLTCLSKRNTNLPVDFWVESKGINYGRKHNPYKILIANGYDRYAFRYLNKALWVSIDKDKPKVIRYKKIRIKKEDLQKVFDYVKEHYKDLDDHIKYDDDDFSLHTRLLGTKEEKENLEYSLLFWLRKETTGLLADIYLETKESQQRMWCKDKFTKPNIYIDLEYSFSIYLTIEDNPTYLDKDDEDIEYHGFDKEIIENKIKPFIRNNKNILLALYNGEIDIEKCLKKLKY